MLYTVYYWAVFWPVVLVMCIYYVPKHISSQLELAGQLLLAIKPVYLLQEVGVYIYICIYIFIVHRDSCQPVKKTKVYVCEKWERNLDFVLVVRKNRHTTSNEYDYC